jgi:hypothetical protein
MYLVTSGDIEKVYQESSSPEEAALLLLETEDGPFGDLICVSKHEEVTKRVLDAKFFHTKTLLQQIEEETNQRVLNLHKEIA